MPRSAHLAAITDRDAEAIAAPGGAIERVSTALVCPEIGRAAFGHRLPYAAERLDGAR